MTNEMFQYSLLQYRGDPVRREALNVGVAVVGHDGRSRVVIDRSAPSRIVSLWPSFSRSLFFAFTRDLRHALADTHQMLLGEKEQLSASGSSLESLAQFSSNGFGLTEPRSYIASCLSDAADRLFRRFIKDAPPAPRKTRYMARAALRSMIGDILGSWARARASDLTIEAKTEVAGAITTHMADLVAFEDARPRMLFFATPLVGPSAPLIRDALPTVVNDLRKRYGTAQYFAVLGDAEVDLAKADNPATVARTILKDVPGLTVLGLDELRREFPTQAEVVA
ncbi:MAG: DUF3037 domain-containing protein [Dehalococcoidia bacterium]|nr:DUF3037 domain-containing protein [Dehalococcoidia bacterium]